MAKRNRKKKELEPTVEDVQVMMIDSTEPVTELEPEVTELEDQEEAAAEAEVESDNAKGNSVVAGKFKDKYLAQARELGIKGKAAKRSTWDWLAQRIAEHCLGPKDRINIDDFLALLEANGVDHSRWTNRNKGWEGRLRMTGRVALQKIVATNGELKYPNGEAMAAPSEWIGRFKTKE